MIGLRDIQTHNTFVFLLLVMEDYNVFIMYIESNIGHRYVEAFNDLGIIMNSNLANMGDNIP